MNRVVLDKIYWPIVFFILIQVFVSSEVFWILGIFTIIYILLLKEKGRFIIPFSEYRLLFYFWIWGAVLGLALFLLHGSDLRDYLRDLFYYSTSMIFIYVGAYYARKGINIYCILNAYIISATILSIIYLSAIVQKGATYLFNSDIHGWRSITGGGAIVVGVALSIILSGIISEKDALPRSVLIPCVIIIGLFFVISLSRINLLILLIMTFVLSTKKNNVVQMLRRMVILTFVGMLAIWLMTVLLPSGIIKVYSEKIWGSLTEISVNNEWTATIVQKNWRGYENHCAINQWESADVINQIIGFGFGKRIYVGGYAYTLLGQLMSDGSTADSIAVLHNGYATQLIKLGVLGVILYIVFYIQLIRKGSRSLKKTNSLEAKILYTVGIVLLIQTYFLNGLFKDYCFYPFVIIIGYACYKVDYLCEKLEVH